MRLAPEVYTTKVKQSKDFYCNHLGFVVKKEIEDFVILTHKESPGYDILFCKPNLQFVDKIFWPEYQGKGIIFQMEVENVDEEYQRLKRDNVPIVLSLRQEPVNGRHFTVADPNGILIDIVQFK